MTQHFPSERSVTQGTQPCQYCGTRKSIIKLGRPDIGAFNKPGVVVTVCELCDRFSDQPHYPKTDGTEADVQES